MRDPTIVQSPVAMKRITVAYGAIRECATHQKCRFAQCYAMYGGTTSASDVTAIHTPIRRVSAPSARTPDAVPPRGLPEIISRQLPRRNHHQPIVARLRAPGFARAAEHLPHLRAPASEA